ncbi:MAG: Fe-S cluster assembly protein HesB, partial [Microbacterium sp.]
MTLHITGDADADRLLTDDPLALLIGMLLDQQVAMETAFAGPLKIQERVGSLDAATLAHYDPDEFAAVFTQTPAVHR